MEPAKSPDHAASKPERSEETLLMHSLGNAVAVLFFDLDSLQRTREKPQEFQAAYDSMYQELMGLKDIAARVATLLAPKGASRTTTGRATSGGSGESRAPAAHGGAPKSDAVAGDVKTPIRVLCVDDSADITDGLRMIIESEPDMQYVGSLTSADSLLSEVKRLCGPSNARADTGRLLVLIDAAMPGKDPLEAIREIAAAYPQTRTIMYSGYDGTEFVDRARDAGAWRCISKSDDPVTLLRILREVATP